MAAPEVAKRPEAQGKLIVVILPDTAEHYLTTRLLQNISPLCLPPVFNELVSPHSGVKNEHFLVWSQRGVGTGNRGAAT